MMDGQFDGTTAAAIENTKYVEDKTLKLYKIEVVVKNDELDYVKLSFKDNNGRNEILEWGNVATITHTSTDLESSMITQIW